MGRPLPTAALLAASRSLRLRMRRGALARTAERAVAPEASAKDRWEKLRFQFAVGGCLGGVLFCSWTFGKCRQQEKDHGQAPDHGDYVWASATRGPLASPSYRAIIVGPLAACWGSAVLATVTVYLFPHRAAWVAMSECLHSVLGLPLAILIAFRFQAAHDRWWRSRDQIEQLASSVVGVAVASASSADDRKSSAKAAIDNELRILGLLDALCYFAEEQLMCGQDPHEANMPALWHHWSHNMSDEDRKVCPCARPQDYGPESTRKFSHSEVCWCIQQITSCVQVGQAKGSFSPETTSHLHGLLHRVLESFRQCSICVLQSEPSAFVVHTRTFVYLYCFTYPWSRILIAPRASMIPTQFAVSFALLGIEFCAREMDYPFGDDEGDLPVRRILADVRQEISSIRDRSYHASLSGLA